MGLPCCLSLVQIALWSETGWCWKSSESTRIHFLEAACSLGAGVAASAVISSLSPSASPLTLRLLRAISRRTASSIVAGASADASPSPLRRTVRGAVPRVGRPLSRVRRAPA
eukprot:7983034-Pyramimonas_sp.AAC.1